MTDDHTSSCLSFIYSFFNCFAGWTEDRFLLPQIIICSLCAAIDVSMSGLESKIALGSGYWLGF
ncbi:hypothetical protein BCY86_05595 [Pajaroellobacter abortibovis]|uniref:Uncharacterized protein n=1 Tax=Pajaroellobacter abortibovis TaxID=1882918 RepID=A0A1L6MXK2_9BACT|nr:hypothetical protein BCY86_05595 [Pajaroellobacter abortibovis]